MRVQLDRRWTEKLADMPESGMGYQRVRVRLRTGREIEEAVVFNAQVLEVPEAAPSFAAEDIVGIELLPQRAR